VTWCSSTGASGTARSDNLSEITRKVVFLGYTYRWIAIRDDVNETIGQPWWQDLTGVQRQLLGGLSGVGDGDHHWGHYPEDTPLYVSCASAACSTRSTRH